MELKKYADYDQMSEAVAKEIAAHVRRHPRTVLGLATGSTPIGLYRELIRHHREEQLDFSEVITFNLDEYYGIQSDHPQSYHRFMQDHFFAHVNIPEQHIHIPESQPEDVQSYCRRYDEMIEEAGGIDIQILGIGSNGHIGFNEPAEELQLHTHQVQLAPSTIEANSRFFSSPDEVPRSAITMGMRSILKARRIFLLASGEGKAPIVKKLMKPAISTRLPASLLWLHDNVQICVDGAAAQLL